ncbi:hypothetical protein G6L61_24595 [Agrobacterium fabrum]|nr:hypothetical protein [Agrobacterium fabrum]
MHLPSPHPLDFDWRYSDDTVSAISEVISKSATVVAGGTPSIARYLDAVARDVILVDRQPFQGVRKHVVGEVGHVRLKIQQAVAVLDPPWYPPEAMQWIAWASNVVGVGGEILVTIWPADTRPSAEQERRDLENWIRGWAEISHTDLPISYVAPSFEEAALAVSAGINIQTKPRIGELLRITVAKEQAAIILPRRNTSWARFTLNEYQLAIRKDPPTTGAIEIAPVRGANGWIWPYVSRRAAGRDEISLWSSQNEVALVGNSGHLIDILRAYARTELSLTDLHCGYPQLAQWAIPAPPFWRSAEWQHQQ